MAERTFDLNSVIAALRSELEVNKEVTSALEKVEQARLRQKDESSNGVKLLENRKRRKASAAAPAD